jgi:hypothetical protein
MTFYIYSVNALTPDNVRKSLDGTLWICHIEHAPQGLIPLQTLSNEDAYNLMNTPAWKGEDETI